MKKLVSLILACLLCLTALPVLAEETAAAPKYVFLFIGDGMSYPQFQAAADYLGALADDDAEQALPSVKDDERGGAVLDGPKALNFMNFPVAGSAVTFEYFAGGALKKVNGAEGDKESLYDLAEKAGYKENQTPFEDAMKDVEELFGLKLAGDEGDRLVLTEYETERLKAAYELVLGDAAADSYTQEQSLLYGGYNPFSVTVTHILNNKSGVDFTSYSHTGLPVAVFAQGAGEDAFTGYYDNTEIYNKLAALVDVK